MKLKDKVALVTGSSRGVGRSIAVGFAQAGAKVVVNYTSNEKAGIEVADSIKALGSEAILVKADVAQKADVDKLIKATIDQFGKIDILVNNAGFTRPNMMLKMTEQEWDQVVDLHLKGAFLCAQAAGNHMKNQNSGKIINITSVAGVVGTVGQINYSAAKGGCHQHDQVHGPGTGAVQHLRECHLPGDRGDRHDGENPDRREAERDLHEPDPPQAFCRGGGHCPGLRVPGIG